MKITNAFLQKSVKLNDIFNNKNFKKLTWTINYENGIFIVNKMDNESKISNITVSKEKFFYVYGSENSDGINNFFKIVCYKNDETEGIQKYVLFESIFTIPYSKNIYFFYQHPFMINLNKIFAHIYE